MSAIKSAALKEPLVDIVNPSSINSTTVQLAKFDILTVTKAELAFVSDFEVVAQRDDYVHAFLAWFDIGFGACHKPIEFSTGPHTKYTHWYVCVHNAWRLSLASSLTHLIHTTPLNPSTTNRKQTVFYLTNPIAIANGESIRGRLECKPNGKNPRDLDITIDYAFAGSTGSVQEKIEYHMC